MSAEKSLFHSPADLFVQFRNSWFITGLPNDELLVTPATMYHGFSIPPTFEMTWLLLVFDFCPVQLPPMVVLIYEQVKLLEKKYFGIKFVFVEIVLLIRIVEEQWLDYPLFKVEHKASSDWVHMSPMQLLVLE